MAVNGGLELLSQYNIQKSVDALQTVDQRPDNLLWYNRIPLQDTDEDEILARSADKVVIADILADDAKARTIRSEPITLHDLHVPNIKLGADFTQKELNLLRRLESGNNTLPEDFRSVRGAIAKKLVWLEKGVKARVETMLVGMLTDDLDYNNMGVIFNNITWGMPTEAKVTVSPIWSNTASTPIADILAVLDEMESLYGVTYNRITMRRSTFNLILLTTEFQDLAALYSQITFPATFPINDNKLMMTLVTQMLGGLTIEFYNAQYYTENSYGVRTLTNYLGTDKVILTNTAWDNDASIWDVANGVVTESIVSSIAGLPSNVIGGFTGPQRGPVGYAAANPNLNPPQLSIFDVMRCFPRKTEVLANACLTVL